MNNMNNMNNIDKSKSNKNDGLNAMPTTNSNMTLSYPEPVPSMEKQLSSTQFWINDPLVLFKREEMMDIWPAPLMSIEQKLNAISRIVILLSILGFLITKNVNILFTGAITLAIFVMMYKLQYQEQYDEKNGDSGNGNDAGNGNNGNDKKKEGFTNSTFNEPINNPIYSKPRGALKPNLTTTPTVANPMMNVLLPEIAYNPERKQAALAYNPKVEKEINHSTEVATVLDFEPKTLTEAEKLRKKLFADLGDKYEFDDSMRSFYTNPSTTIPNDQKAFAEFCYGSMISCKEGNEFACQRFNPVLGSVIN
jgi:ribosomal protein L15